MMVCLRVLDAAGNPTGAAFPFDSHGCFLFGRDANAHCRVTDDPAVSRHHFLLEVIPPDARIKDLGSTNGIHVNGVHFGGKDGRRNPDGSAAVVALRHGDRIRAGKTQIEVQINLPATEPATFMDGTALTIALEPSPQTSVAADAGAPPGDGPPAGASSPEEKINPGSGELDQFCDCCGKLISGASAVTREGKTYCLACRMESDTRWKRKGLIAAAARAHAGAEAPDIQGYKLGQRLGQGGMGIVYRAARLSDGAEVAVKALLAETCLRPENTIIFRREIALMRSLSHENVVAFHDAGQANGRLFLVMEYLPGGNLERRIAKSGSLPVKIALPWMRQMTAGLAAAHGRNLVHRDIKPANVLLDGPGTMARAKIADFGLAKSLAAAGLSGFTATGMGAGTASCMPPEQLTDFKRATKAADVFSLGATFYEMLAGRSAYNFKPGKEHAATILAFEMTPLSERCPKLPKALTALVDRCLRSDPALRFADAGEIEAELTKIRE